MSKKRGFYTTMAEMVMRTWKDEKFKKEFLNNPRQVLQDYGVQIPRHLHVKVEQGNTFGISLTIPQKPQSTGSLNKAELQRITSGKISDNCYSENPCKNPHQ